MKEIVEFKRTQAEKDKMYREMRNMVGYNVEVKFFDKQINRMTIDRGRVILKNKIYWVATNETNRLIGSNLIVEYKVI